MRGWYQMATKREAERGRRNLDEGTDGGGAGMTKILPGRADYRFFLEIPTRWMDNDIYGHVNT